MRLTSWIFIVAAVVTALGVFMPLLEVGGHVVSKHQTLSLHGAANERALVRKVLGAYRRSHAAHVGGAVVTKVTPHAGGRTKDYLEDAGDAMDTLSSISDADAVQAGRALLIVTWLVIALCAAMIACVFFDVINGAWHRGRIIAAVAIAVVVAALALAIRIGANMVAFEANDELGAAAVQLGSATLAMPLAAIVGLCAAIATLVLHVRQRRAGVT